MKSTFLKISLVISILLIEMACYAQFNIQIDQDLFDFVGRNQDRNYTMGLQITTSSNYLSQLYVFSNKIVKKHASILLFEKNMIFRPNQAHTLSLGSVNFTPDSLNSPDIIPNDRPYSSLVYFAFGNQIMNSKFTKSLTTELKIGLMGLHIGNKVQTRIHIWNRASSGKKTPYDPLGWDNQVKNGGFLAIQYSINPKFNIGDILGNQMRVDYRIDVGNYMNSISVNSIMFFGDPLTNILNFDANMIGSSNGAKRAENSNKSLFGYISINPNLIIYNRAVTGQPDIPISLNPLVLRLSAGLAFEWKRPNNAYSIILSQNFRSPEFSSNDGLNERWHSWGGITFSCTPNN